MGAKGNSMESTIGCNQSKNNRIELGILTMKAVLQCVLVIIGSSFLQVNVWAATCAGADNPAASFICTANDITVTSVSTNVAPPAYCIAGETVILDLTANIGGSTNAQRGDVGLYFLESTTDVSILEPISDDFGATCTLVTAPPSFPFTDLDGDSVGDVDGQLPKIGGLPIAWDVGVVSVLCDPNGAAGINVRSLVDYGTKLNVLGTNPYVPDGSSKCSRSTTSVTLGVLGSLTVTKQALSDDGSNFNFTYTNSNAPSSSPTPNPPSPFGLLHSASSDPIYIDIGTTGGTIAVTEVVPSQYNLTGVTCVDTQNATNTVTPAVTGNTFTVDITATSAQVECTVTNERKPTVEVEKIWVDASLNDAVSITTSGGTNNVALAAVANTASETDVDAALYVQTAGDTITFAESFTTGVATNYNIGLSCTNATSGGTVVSGVTFASPSFTVANQDEITCSYTNTSKLVDLIITKTVNDTTPNIGDTVTFSLLVENLGPGTAIAVSVTDIVPAGFTYVTGTMTGGVVPADESSPAGSGLIWTINSLNAAPAAGSSTTLTFQAVVNAP